MGLHGISKDNWKKYLAKSFWDYEFIGPCYKNNLTDVATVIGLAQLREVTLFLERCRQIALTYTEALKICPK